MLPENGLALPAPEGFWDLLNGIRDPGNVGMIMRTAWAAGVKDLFFTPRHSGPVFRESCQSVARRRLPISACTGARWPILRLGAGSRRYLLGGDPRGGRIITMRICQAGLDCFGPRNPGAGGGCPGKRERVQIPRSREAPNP